MVMDRTPMHMSMNMINYKFMHTSMADLAAVRDHNGTAGKAAAGSVTPEMVINSLKCMHYNSLTLVLTAPSTPSALPALLACT